MDLAKKEILIVEDEFIASEYLKRVLLSLGATKISVANSAKKSLEIIQKKYIDLVFMDINIDGSVDGIECGKRVNQEYDIPIIYTTAYKDNHTIIEARDTNIHGYLIKPFKEEDVFISLSLLFKERKKSQEKEQESGLTLNGYYYDKEKKQIFENQIRMQLTPIEEEILHIFFSNMDQDTSYEVLKERVWENKKISNSTIRDTISRLRKKLPNLVIKNIPSYGYILKQT